MSPAANDMHETILDKSEQATSRPLRLGFVPLSDCAPVVMAKELNLFAKYGIEVQLRREIGWATLRDKICYGELDAAHALAPLVLSITLGMGAPPTECLTGLILSLEGNGITLSQRLWQSGVRDGQSLRRHLERTQTPLTLAIPFVYSAHHFLLRAWLQGLGFVPERVARVVVVPPPQMPYNLRSGNLDGYCVGEPWNSRSVLARIGWLAATSADLQPRHPEKVLLVRRDFAEKRGQDHKCLIAALLEACRYCAEPAHAEAIAQTLARPEYVNTSPQSLNGALGLNSVSESIRCRAPRPIFYGAQANQPAAEKASWIAQNLRASMDGGDLAGALSAAGERGFRSDIFQQAMRLASFPRYETQAELKSLPALA